MRKFLQKVSFKPIDVKNAVQLESNTQKVRIVVFGVLMGIISTTYQAAYDGISYRSSQLQKAALAGQKEWARYESPNQPTVWAARQTLKILDEKPFKDLKYIVEGW